MGSGYNDLKERCVVTMAVVPRCSNHLLNQFGQRRVGEVELCLCALQLPSGRSEAHAATSGYRYIPSHIIFFVTGCLFAEVNLPTPFFLTRVNLLFSPAAAAAMASTTLEERRWMRFEVDA